MEMTFEELMEKHEVQIFTKYKIKAEAANKLLGGWPKDPATELAMLEARFKKGLVKEETVEKARLAVAEASSDDHEEETEKAKLKAWTGFKSDDNGIYIESRQIKAGFREVSKTLEFTRGWSNLQVFQHALFAKGLVDADKIYFYGEDDKRIVEPHGHEQMIAHVMTMQGPRSTIKFHDYVNPGTKFSFEVWISDPQKNRFDEKYLANCLMLAQDNGFGCSRSQGHGRIKVLTIELLAEGTIPTIGKKKAAKKKATKKAS
jgi:CRISPR/Cas system CSM-associated protein Csm4 (group 5 of RAMP superfamily)